MHRSGSCCHFGHVEGMMLHEPSSPGTGLGDMLGYPRLYSRHSGKAGLVLGFCLELGMAQRGLCWHNWSSWGPLWLSWESRGHP